MAVTAEITRKFDNGNVQVEKKKKNASTKYYEVPANKADSFIKTYKDRAKKNLYLTNSVFAGSILAGVLLASALVKKFVKNKFLKFALPTMGGIVASIAGMMGTWNYIDKKDNEIIKQHNAKEIFYSA